MTATVAEDPVATASATVARLSVDLTEISSDAYEGRGAGTQGLAKAGEYIATRFAELGYKTDSFDGTPFQDFSIQGGPAMGPPEMNKMQIAVDGKPVRELALGKDFNPLALGSNGTFSAPVVFAGYGITAADIGYDDYKDIDVTGKIVIVIRKEPRQNDPNSVFDGTRPSQYSFFTTKEVNAALHKAAGMIVVNDIATADAGRQQKWDAIKASVDKIAGLKEKLATAKPGTPEADALLKSLRGEADQIQATEMQLNQGADPLLAFDGAGTALTSQQVPTLVCRRDIINDLLKQSTGKSLDDYEADIDRDMKPVSVELPGVVVSGQTEVNIDQIPVRNVVGVLPGSGDLAGEYLVVGAHYDHVGMGGVGSLAPGTIAVHNGADDNGSGTVMLLEIAKRMAGLTNENRRTLVFIAFAGEELGLLGSEHYVRNPRFSLEQTVAMVNMDMVGRMVDDQLTIYGTGTATEFDAMLDTLNERYQFKLNKERAGFGPSDHSSFYGVKVPVFHFFTGLHNDYHRPSDDFDKINVIGMARITDMVSDLVTTLSSTPQRPTYVEVQGYANPQQQSSPRRPTLGVRLAAVEEGVGIAIEEITKDSPADKAGLIAGDRILRVGETEINNIADLQTVMGQVRRNATLAIEIQRGEEKKTIDVKLGR